MLRVGVLVSDSERHREAGIQVAMKSKFREELRESLEMPNCIAERVLNVVTCPPEFGNAEVSDYISKGALQATSREYIRGDVELHRDTGVRSHVGHELCFDAGVQTGAVRAMGDGYSSRRGRAS